MRRVLAAPVEKVYAAWTNEKALGQWHAPFDYTVPFAEANVKVGGRYRIAMRAPHKDITTCPVSRQKLGCMESYFGQKGKGCERGIIGH